MELIKEFDHQGNYLFKYRGTLPLFILGIGLAVYTYMVRQHGQSSNAPILRTATGFFAWSSGYSGNWFGF